MPQRKPRKQPRQDGPQAAAGGTESCMEGAWVLRSLVLPALSEPLDMAHVALALPCALARCCIDLCENRREYTFGRALADALVSAVLEQRERTVAAIRSTRPFMDVRMFDFCNEKKEQEALVWACSKLPRCLGVAHSEETQRHLGALFRRPRGALELPLKRTLETVVTLSSMGVSSAIRAVSTVLDAKGSDGHPAEEIGQAMSAACVGGHARAVEVLGSCFAAAARPSDLGAACIAGNADLVRMLGRPPFCLGHDDVMSAQNSCWPAIASNALEAAAAHGRYAVLQALVEPPFSIGSRDVDVDSAVQKVLLDYKNERRHFWPHEMRVGDRRAIA
eukprot:m51a1_g4379 hypothetical protein (334) ;mRNA; f:327097-328349